MTKLLPLIYVLLGLALVSPLTLADESALAIAEPSDKSAKCIKPEDEMRRNHMNYILHQRNETMRKGIRTTKNSLAKCIDCHVEPNENGEIASIESKEHFCHGCHQYAAVQIDCFQCHADRPQKYIKRASKKNQYMISEAVQQSLVETNQAETTQAVPTTQAGVTP